MQALMKSSFSHTTISGLNPFGIPFMPIILPDGCNSFHYINYWFLTATNSLQIPSVRYKGEMEQTTKNGMDLNDFFPFISFDELNASLALKHWFNPGNWCSIHAKGSSVFDPPKRNPFVVWARPKAENKRTSRRTFASCLPTNSSRTTSVFLLSWTGNFLGGNIEIYICHPSLTHSISHPTDCAISVLTVICIFQ